MVRAVDHFPYRIIISGQRRLPYEAGSGISTYTNLSRSCDFTQYLEIMKFGNFYYVNACVDCMSMHPYEVEMWVLIQLAMRRITSILK